MFRFLKNLGFYSRFGRLYNREMSSSEIRAQKNQPPSLISSLPEEIFVDIVAPCLSILLPENLSQASMCFRSLIASPELYTRRSYL